MRDGKEIYGSLTLSLHPELVVYQFSADGSLYLYTGSLTSYNLIYAANHRNFFTWWMTESNS